MWIGADSWKFPELGKKMCRLGVMRSRKLKCQGSGWGITYVMWRTRLLRNWPNVRQIEGIVKRYWCVAGMNSTPTEKILFRSINFRDFRDSIDRYVERTEEYDRIYKQVPAYPKVIHLPPRRMSQSFKVLYWTRSCPRIESIEIPVHLNKYELASPNIRPDSQKSGAAPTTNLTFCSNLRNGPLN